ncbi:hypothetical protein [Massilia horti]|uniref:Uncharacterized protein n=1 Tax=Massilia horti TaxID=2562153 RepID=A0A4Y9SZK0_9BURK|nr:hypothetical protein [Massilia horti]TFW32343.1 hypothetical protein E4O92_10275 [Massilia horti]
MISRYKLVALDDAAAGMVLADEVRDRLGNVLLAQGAALSESLLQALRRRGVESIRIEEDGLSPEQLAAERERVSARLAHLFRKPHSGAANATLRAELTAYRMEQLK